MPHFQKFIAFLRNNNYLPFVIKKRVFDACVMSTMLYGCESWLNGDLKPVAKIYHWALKQLLGVRSSTCNDVCYIESGYTSIKAIVKSKQRIYFNKVYGERFNLLDDPLGFVLRLVFASEFDTRNCLTNFVTNRYFDDIQQ